MRELHCGIVGWREPTRGRQKYCGFRKTAVPLFGRVHRPLLSLRRGKSSCVDLVVAAGAFAHDFLPTARYGHALCGSGHLPVVLVWSAARTDKVKQHCGRARIARKRVDWKAFEADLASTLRNCGERCMQNLQKCIQQATKKLPKGRPAAAEQLAITAQRMNSVKLRETAAVWRVLRAPQQRILPLRAPGGWLLSERAKARALRAHFKTLCRPDVEAAVQDLSSMVARVSNAPVPFLSVDEMKLAVEGMAGTAPGLDGILPEMVSGEALPSTLRTERYLEK